MNKNKFKKYCLLVVIVLISTFFTIELLLFLGGKIFLFLQENEYIKDLDRPGSYRILCLGDSTTAIGGKISWPSQLAFLLNQDTKKFTVINRGVILADSQKMLTELKEDLGKYQPHMVILMGGINDVKKARQKQTIFSNLSDFFANFHTYRLFQEFSSLARSKSTEKYISTEEIYQNQKLIKNFNEMHEITTNKKIVFVVMQYPLRKIEPLKNIFSFSNGIIFIDNENNFKKVLSEKNYSDLFIDSFGGDFGHGTKEGNFLIAENIYEKIKYIKIYD